MPDASIRRPRSDGSFYSAGFAGAFIDREVETRGLDFIDREKAKYQGEWLSPARRLAGPRH